MAKHLHSLIVQQLTEIDVHGFSWNLGKLPPRLLEHCLRLFKRTEEGVSFCQALLEKPSQCWSSSSPGSSSCPPPGDQGVGCLKCQLWLFTRLRGGNLGASF